MCERVRCHGGETNCFSSTCLDVCAECPPSAASKAHSKTCHWRFDQGVRVPYGQCLGCRKTINMDLPLLRTWRAFIRPRRIWRLPLRRLLLSLRVITIYPRFVTGYDIGDEGEVVCSLLFECPTDRNAKGLLVFAQQSWNKSRRNASHIQIVRQNALNGPIWQSYYLTDIVDSLPTICKDSLANVCYVFRCCSCRGRPERSSSSTDVRPSWSVCTIIKFCFGSWHYFRRLPVEFGGLLL